MERSQKIVVALGIFIVFIGLSQTCPAQSNALPMKEDYDAYVLKYLKSDSEWRKPHATFTGKFVPLVKELEQALDAWFAKHWFTIAVMETGLGPQTRGGMRHQNVLFAGDKKTGKVIGYSWSFGPCSEGFRTILSDYEWVLEDYADVQLKTLGDLLLYTLKPNRDAEHSIAPRVGRILDNGKGVVDVELILRRTAIRILRVRKNAKGKFTRLSFLEPGFKQEY
jgi:hypothetical protein